MGERECLKARSYNDKWEQPIADSGASHPGRSHTCLGIWRFHPGRYGRDSQLLLSPKNQPSQRFICHKCAIPSIFLYFRRNYQNRFRDSSSRSKTLKNGRMSSQNNNQSGDDGLNQKQTSAQKRGYFI